MNICSVQLMIEGRFESKPQVICLVSKYQEEKQEVSLLHLSSSRSSIYCLICRLSSLCSFSFQTWLIAKGRGWIFGGIRHPLSRPSFFDTWPANTPDAAGRTAHLFPCWNVELDSQRSSPRQPPKIISSTLWNRHLRLWPTYANTFSRLSECGNHTKWQEFEKANLQLSSILWPPVENSCLKMFHGPKNWSPGLSDTLVSPNTTWVKGVETSSTWNPVATRL